jgi:response regulator RpfG family c-di-GMP phosphodiesterase
VLAQARALAVQGPALHTLGLAALLHDVGKLGLPPALLGQPGRLGEDDWKVLMRHVDLGAQMLCALDGAPPLAALVAYEHHLRYDGQPSFPVLARQRPPNLASQLTAIADAYDTVRGLRSGDVALAVVRGRAGSVYDPFLAGRFVKLFSSATASTA